MNLPLRLHLSHIRKILLSVCILSGSTQAIGQAEIQVDQYEKLVKKKGLYGLKSKLHHVEIEPLYNDLILTKEFVLAIKGERADLYRRNNFTSYLVNIQPKDTSLVYNFHKKLFPEYNGVLLYQDGKWGWRHPRYTTPVNPQYDSIGTLNSKWYIVYKNGRGAVADVTGKILSPFIEYGYSHLVSSGFDGYFSKVAKKDASGVEFYGAYLNADTVSFIPAQYYDIVIEDFPNGVTLNQKTHRGWVAARYASGKTDYYDMHSLKRFSGDEVDNILAIRQGRKNNHETLIKELKLYRVFRNEKGKLGVVGPNGEVIVPPGLSSLSFKYNITAPGLNWYASPDKNGLQLTENFTNKKTTFSADTAYLFTEIEKQNEASSFELSATIATTNNQYFKIIPGNIPPGGYFKIVEYNKCRDCTNGKVPAHYVKRTETYQIAPAQTTTRTEKLVSKDLDKDGKFPTRTVTTTTPARMGTKTHNELVPEHACTTCDAKGNIATVTEWNATLQVFETKRFGATSKPK